MKKSSPKQQNNDKKFTVDNLFELSHQNNRKYVRKQINNIYHRKVIISLK